LSYSVNSDSNQSLCSTIQIEVMTQNNEIWKKCVLKTESETKQIYSFASNENFVHIRIVKKSKHVDNLRPFMIYVEYKAFGYNSECAFGEIFMDDKCILIVNKAMSWKDAEDNCQKNGGGHLISIGNEMKQHFIEEIIQHRYF
jgi:hypothetical protein